MVGQLPDLAQSIPLGKQHPTNTILVDFIGLTRIKLSNTSFYKIILLQNIFIYFFIYASFLSASIYVQLKLRGA